MIYLPEKYILFCIGISQVPPIFYLIKNNNI